MPRLSGLAVIVYRLLILFNIDFLATFNYAGNDIRASNSLDLSQAVCFCSNFAKVMKRYEQTNSSERHGLFVSTQYTG